MKFPKDYKLLQDFIETYLPGGFKGIKPEDPLMVKINAMMRKNNQYFYFGDMLKFEIYYTSKTIEQILGIKPSEFDPGVQFKCTHPEDLQRHAVSRAKMIRISNDIFCSKSEGTIFSTNLRYQHTDGHYVNCLNQAYTFYSEIPEPTVYGLFVNTDIGWFGPIKHGYHFYIGNDLSYLRVPDKELIHCGCFFTDREYEILNLIREGMDSKQIGENLFLSTHTVDTHRRNIIKKTNYQSTSELIIDLQEKGFF